VRAGAHLHFVRALQRLDEDLIDLQAVHPRHLAQLLRAQGQRVGRGAAGAACAPRVRAGGAACSQI
jgi:hypothetical protein